MSRKLIQLEQELYARDKKVEELKQEVARLKLQVKKLEGKKGIEWPGVPPYEC